MDTAAISFISLVVGAALQYVFTKHLEDRKHLRDLRASAYADYFRCVADHAARVVVGKGSIDASLSARTADAKCRVCLYASPKVIAAFAQFERLGAALNTPDNMDAFSRMAEKMREDSHKTGKADLRDIQVVLMGNKS